MELSADAEAVLRALISHTRSRVTGGREDASELIDVDADVRSLLTGGIAFQSPEKVLSVVRREGETVSDSVLEQMEDSGLVSLERESYVREQDGSDGWRTILTVDAGALDEVMEE